MTQLWPAEVEAMREEARGVVAAGIDAIVEILGGNRVITSADPVTRARAMREQFSVTYATAPEAEERTIADVPCRVFLPSARPRARSTSTSMAAG